MINFDLPVEKLYRAYRTINLLSIDVALGAVACAFFFAEAFQIDVLPQGFAALGITVWCIYTADHLLDARTIRQPASTERHRLHQVRFPQLLTALIAGIIVDFALAFLIRTQLLLAGMVVGLVSALYLVLSRRLLVFKEITGALLYTTGVLVPVWGIYRGTLLNSQLVLVGTFAILVLINILLFALLSHDEDVKDRQPSIVQVIGTRWTRLLLTLLFFLVVMLNAGNITTVNWTQQAVMLMMTLGLLVIFLFPGYFRQHERFRLLGDAVFLCPVLIVLF